jgi:hypothetical protein
MRKLHEAMNEVAQRGRREGKPNSYYWKAVWWRLSARESRTPEILREYSKNQLRLFFDMKNRPLHYSDPKRPEGESDWQWSGLGHNV